MKVSVVMPVYNGALYLQEAIDSILNQTYKDFELVIIDDGSTDDSQEIIRNTAERDRRIVFLKNEKNSGICITLNKGLGIAKGEYIVRMDCDDIALSQRIEKQVAFMEAHPEVAVAGCLVDVFNTNNPSEHHVNPSDSDYYECKADLFFSPCVAHPAVIIRKSILDRYKFLYDDYYRGMEDFHLWWRISRVSNITNVQEVLLRYRIHSKQVTKNLLNEKFIYRQREFIECRVRQLGAQISENEIDAINQYLIDHSTLTDKMISDLISGFSKILKSIKSVDNKYYKAQKLVFGKAITYSCDESFISLKKTKLYYLLKAYFKGTVDHIWFLKRIYYFFK